MQFVVYRTSTWLDTEDESDEYILEETAIPKKFNPRVITLVEDERYRKRRRAAIDINSLEELLDFVKTIKHEVIINDNDCLCEGYPSLEIYDDYRE